MLGSVDKLDGVHEKYEQVEYDQKGWIVHPTCVQFDKVHHDVVDVQHKESKVDANEEAVR